MRPLLRARLIFSKPTLLIGLLWRSCYSLKLAVTILIAITNWLTNGSYFFRSELIKRKKWSRYNSQEAPNFITMIDLWPTIKIIGNYFHFYAWKHEEIKIILICFGFTRYKCSFKYLSNLNLSCLTHL